MNIGIALLIAAIATVSLAIYLTPSLIFVFRNSKNKLAIFLINFFTGATLLGWVGALAWACADIALPKDEEYDSFKKTAMIVIISVTSFFFIAVFAASLGFLEWDAYQKREAIKQDTLDKETALADAKARSKTANEAEYRAKKEAAQAQIEAARLQAAQQEESIIQNDSNLVNLKKAIGKEEYIDGSRLIYLTGLDKGGYKNYMDPGSVKIDGTNIRWVAISIPNSPNKARYRSIREADCAGDWNQITQTAIKRPDEADYSYLSGVIELSDYVAEREKTKVCIAAGLES
jgi:Superinfection immunity protein